MRFRRFRRYPSFDFRYRNSRKRTRGHVRGTPEIVNVVSDSFGQMFCEFSPSINCLGLLFSSAFPFDGTTQRNPMTDSGVSCGRGIGSHKCHCWHFVLPTKEAVAVAAGRQAGDRDDNDDDDDLHASSLRVSKLAPNSLSPFVCLFVAPFVRSTLPMPKRRRRQLHSRGVCLSPVFCMTPMENASATY